MQYGGDLYAKSHDPQGREKTVIDSAMGRNGSNSRGVPRIDVHADTPKLLEDWVKTRHEKKQQVYDSKRRIGAREFEPPQRVGEPVLPVLHLAG
jgi:hypothetical protein